MTNTITNDSVLAGLEDAISDKAKAASWILHAARRHGITISETPLDRFATTVSRLSDAGVQLDDIEQLLVGLARAGVLSDGQRFGLHAAYLRQRRA